MQALEKILEEIDREEKNALLSIEHTTGHKAGALNMANTIKDIIRKHMNDGWIPVDERLPENNEDVLVTTDVGLITFGYIFAWQMDDRPRAGLSYRLAPSARAVQTGKERRMKYRCINEFYIEIYDEGWMPTGEYRTISAGTVWELDESTNNIGGDVHLDNDDEGWIEISREKLEECFEEVRE